MDSSCCHIIEKVCSTACFFTLMVYFKFMISSSALFALKSVIKYALNGNMRATAALCVYVCMSVVCVSCKTDGASSMILFVINDEAPRLSPQPAGPSYNKAHWADLCSVSMNCIACNYFTLVSS